MAIKRLAVLCGLLLALASLSQLAAAADVEIVKDVVYGHKDGLAMTFDVIKPKTGANGAAVLYMVSGGWVSGYSPPDQMATRFAPLLDKGFTMFIVRHGSSPKYLIPDIVADVRRAVRYIRFNAKTWGIDPDRMGVHGASAGGHLSLVLGTASDEGNPNAPEDFMRVSDRVASVVAFFPPTDLRTLARGVQAGPLTGETAMFPALNFDKAKAPDFSPILHVTPDDPPTLLIHGDADNLVNISNSTNILAEFKKADVKVDMITIAGAGHGFGGANATKANEALVNWFEETLVKNPPKKK